MNLIGRYELVGRLGQGGMGVVWKARLPGPVPTFVALKLLHSLDRVSEQERESLLQEARTLAQIRSPHVVRLIEVFEEDGVPCLAMEWLDGASVSELQAEGPLPLSVALRIAADTCSGLHAVHECRDQDGAMLGLVHRDVSPQNIMVDTGGTTKLIDFGIAKAVLFSEGQTLTNVKGKLHYMSREQAGRKPLDRRTDIFSLGVVLYQMLTGEHPFANDNELRLMQALSERAEPKPMPNTIPKLAQQIVLRALQHERESRWPTALAMKQALEDCMQDCGVSLDALQLRESLRDKLKRDRVLTPSGPSRSAPPSAPPPSPPPPAEIDTSRKRNVFTKGAAAGALVVTATSGIAFAVWQAPVSVRNITLYHAASTMRAHQEAPPQVAAQTRQESPATSRTVASSVVKTAATIRIGSAAKVLPTSEQKPAPNCDPPWTIDSAGHRRYRPECP